MLPEDAESLPKHWPFARPGDTSTSPKSDGSKDEKDDFNVNVNSNSTYTTTPATLDAGSSSNNNGTVGSYESNSTPAASTEDSDPAKEAKVSEEKDDVRGGARARALLPAFIPSFSTFDSGSRHSSGSSEDGDASDYDLAFGEAVGKESEEEQEKREKHEKQMMV